MLGTSGRTRTGTLLRAGDFESPMSTNSITLAFNVSFGALIYRRRSPQPSEDGDYSSDFPLVNLFTVISADIEPQPDDIEDYLI